MNRVWWSFETLMDICLPHKSLRTIELNLSQLTVCALKRPRSGVAQMLWFSSFFRLDPRSKIHPAKLIIPSNLHNPKYLSGTFFCLFFFISLILFRSISLAWEKQPLSHCQTQPSGDLQGHNHFSNHSRDSKNYKLREHAHWNLWASGRQSSLLYLLTAPKLVDLTIVSPQMLHRMTEEFDVSP